MRRFQCCDRVDALPRVEGDFKLKALGVLSRLMEEDGRMSTNEEEDEATRWLKFVAKQTIELALLNNYVAICLQ